MKKNPRLQKNVNDKFDIDITKYQNEEEEEEEQDISMSSWLNFIKLSFSPHENIRFKKKFIFLFFERIQFSESELDRTIILFISLSIAASKRSVHKRFNFFAIIRIDAWVLRLTTKWTFKRWICLLRSAIISGVNLFFGTIFSLNCFSWKTRIFTRFFHSTSILYCKSKIKEIIFLSFITSWTSTRKWGGPVPASPRRFNWKILNLFFQYRPRD